MTRGMPLQQAFLQVLCHCLFAKPHAEKGLLKVVPANGPLVMALVDDARFVSHQLHGLGAVLLYRLGGKELDKGVAIRLVAMVAVRDGIIQLLRPGGNDPRLAHVPQEGKVKVQRIVVMMMMVMMMSSGKS